MKPSSPLHLAAALAIFFKITSCVSTKEPSESLDISMEKQTAQKDENITYADVMTKPLGQNEVPPSAVIQWQNFFKAPPSATERSILEKKLAQWREDSSASELLAKGRNEAALGRLSAAEASFRRALRLNEDYLEAQLELASLYLRMKQMGRAFEFLTQVRDNVIASDKISQSFLFKYRYTLALAYIARGERSKGHQILSDLIGIDRTFIPAYAALAASYIEIDKDAIAEFILQRGLDRSKEDASLLNIMGVIAEKSQHFETARQWFDKSLALNPNYAPALINRAKIAVTLRELDAAEEDLQKAIQQDPLSVDALITLGVVQKSRGNFTGARASFSKAIDNDPTNPLARYNLGLLMANDLKRPNEALRLFHEVMQTAPANSEIRDLARNFISDLKNSNESF